jgi:dipeptidyl aminopeptidase/acylaminoacyl peptidase
MPDVADERSEPVSFYSAGARLAATLMLPVVAGDGPVPVVVQGPGWLGLRSAKLYRPYHEAFLEAGLAVLTLDYRGFGESEGDASYLDPMEQVADIRRAIDWLECRDELDASRVGVFGSGGTGGGNAIAAAGLDERIKAVVSQVPIADGRDWLHRMRSEYDWLAFLARVADDRRTRARTGQGEWVSAREGIVLPTPERRTTTVKSDVDSRIPEQVLLASADAIIDYRPLDLVARIAPRAVMIICGEGDATTPEDHAFSLYQRAGGPKRLVVQTGTTHYAAYAQYQHQVAPLMTDWFRTHLVTGPIAVHEQPAEASGSYLSAT